MDGKAKTGTDVLSSIVATLLSLAALAERLGDMPCDVRRRVLAVLHHAEIVAHAARFEVARDYGAPAPPPAETMTRPPDRDSPSDAAQLALRLRALALVWSGLAAWVESVACRQARDGLDTLASAVLRAVAGAHIRLGHAVTPSYADTS